MVRKGGGGNPLPVGRAPAGLHGSVGAFSLDRESEWRSGSFREELRAQAGMEGESRRIRSEISLDHPAQEVLDLCFPEEAFPIQGHSSA